MGFRFLLLVVLVSVGFCPRAGAYSIVCPDEPRPWEATAVETLRHALGQCVADGQLTVAGAGDVIFHVGDTAFAKEKGLTSDRLADEERVIRSFGRDVVLNGGGRRGCLYAVYSFLDEQCGVRWWGDGEIDYPAPGALALPRLDIRRKPFFFFREIYRDYGVCPEDNANEGRRDPVVAVANMLNRNGQRPIPVELGGGLGYGGPNHCHTFDHYLPYKKYGKDHPEWYALRDGKRTGGQMVAQMCLTNPEVKDGFVREMLAWVRKDEESAAKEGVAPPRIYDLSMNDNHGSCSCAVCREATEKYGHSGVMLNLVNAVAAELAKTRPDILVTTFAYYYTEPVPKGGVRAADNVIVKLCNTVSDEAAALSSENNRVFRERLAEWRQYARNILIWDYAITFGPQTEGFPFASEFHFADKYRIYAANGVMGVFWEQEHPSTSDMPELKFRLMTKLLDDPRQDDGPIIADFMQRFFGPAGDDILAARRILDRAHAEGRGYVQWMARPIEFGFITAEHVAAVKARFDAAERAVAGDERRLRRVRRARAGFDRYAASGVPEMAQKRPLLYSVAEYGKKFFNVEPSDCGTVTNDPQSAFGCAFRFVTDDRPGAVALPFSGAIYDRKASNVYNERKLTPAAEPGYAWYSLGHRTMPRSGYAFWLNWHLQFTLGQPWIAGRDYEVRLHARLEGPKYRPGAAGTNNVIWVDAVEFVENTSSERVCP